MRKAFPHMLAGDLNKHLDEKFPDKKPHLIIHCWGDWCGHSENLHCGTHTENIRGFLNCRLWPSTLKRCREKVEEYWASGRTTTIRVTCVCDVSIHASDGIAAILQNIYHQSGYNSKGPYHIDPLPRMCWNCGECKQNVKKDYLMSVVTADFIFREELQ